MIKQYVINKFLKNLEKIEYGSIHLVTPDDIEYFFGDNNSEITTKLHIKNWQAIFNLFTKGDVGFTESYRDGLFECDNLTNLIKIGLRNDEVLEQYLYGNMLSNIASQILYYLRSNTLKGSKKNIHHHYDLGNDFYSLWLDPSMTYSSAIFHNDNLPLELAQKNKYDRIIEKLSKKSGSLLEVGCGWGGFAERATQIGDYNIKGITISDKQHSFAKQRLGSKACVELQDYRRQTGKYDNIVSIEMFEAVGEKYWPVYFGKMKDLLHSKGRAVIQTITIGEKYFDRYRKSSDMLRSFIFPGGMLPSTERFKAEADKAELRVTDHFEFGQDYAKTIMYWLDSFEKNIDRVKQMGFDEKFIRVWRFYLSACIASFSVGRTNVIQAEISHA